MSKHRTEASLLPPPRGTCGDAFSTKAIRWVWNHDGHTKRKRVFESNALLLLLLLLLLLFCVVVVLLLTSQSSSTWHAHIARVLVCVDAFFFFLKTERLPRGVTRKVRSLEKGGGLSHNSPLLINPNSEDSLESTLFGVGGWAKRTQLSCSRNVFTRGSGQRAHTHPATVHGTHLTYYCAPRQAPTHTSTKLLTYLSLRSF